MKTAEPTAAKYAYVTMLGGFSITVDGQMVSDEANRTHKLWNVLAYLVAHRGRMVPQTEFIEQFWPDEKRGRARQCPKDPTVSDTHHASAAV